MILPAPLPLDQEEPCLPGLPAKLSVTPGHANLSVRGTLSPLLGDLGLGPQFPQLHRQMPFPWPCPPFPYRGCREAGQFGREPGVGTPHVLCDPEQVSLPLWALVLFCNMALGALPAWPLSQGFISAALIKRL